MSEAYRFDPLLLEAARNGDRAAILSLLSEAQPDIRRYAHLSCKKSQDVDDAVQESLWLLYHRIGTLRVITSFSAWIYAVVRRECWRLFRRAFGRQDDVAVLDDDERYAYRPQDELRHDLSRAIQSLPEHYREIVLLRDIEELSVNEIAALLALSREAVKARLHRARVMIREYLMV